ncbi:MAG: DUF126 domain-containing protein [Methanomassiliicoccales archaeon]|nr:MAG: DUF126 domain-containing protein [Methanomassiliicoccales archaeon]
MKLRGRSISRGLGRGRAVVINGPFSFLGGVDTSTGRLTVSSGKEGADIVGKVFAFERGKGSTVGSYTILDLKKNRKLPSAIINRAAETIVATGAVMAGVPMVDGVDLELIRDDDEIIVDGDEGTVEILDVKESSVVTCILRHGCKILIMKRSEKVATNKLKWAGISGYIEKGETPLETAYKDIAEEVGQMDPKLYKILPVMTVRGDGHIWHIHPFIFDTEDPNVVIDWEHTEYRWITPNELDSYDTVPGLSKLVKDI